MPIAEKQPLQKGMRMKALIIVLLFSLVSCSLIEKRRTHFSYIRPGVSLEEVKSKSGTPLNESFDQDEVLLTYDYCKASWAEEAIYGALTFTTYNWACNKQMSLMHLYFKSGVLYRTEDGSSIYERVHRREQVFTEKAPVKQVNGPQPASN